MKAEEAITLPARLAFPAGLQAGVVFEKSLIDVFEETQRSSDQQPSCNNHMCYVNPCCEYQIAREPVSNLISEIHRKSTEVPMRLKQPSAIFLGSPVRGIARPANAAMMQ